MHVDKINLELLHLFVANGGIGACTHEVIETGFDISPKEFLELAESDLMASYNNHLLNSLTNTKRAIDSQLDSLLIAFGLFKRSKKERWTFPKKIEFLNDMRIISPRILKKINKKRNLLEHEYKNPSEEEVEDALDVASLFISYTDKYLFPGLTKFELFDDRKLWNEDPTGLRGVKLQYVVIELDWMNCKLIFDLPTRSIDGLYDHIIEELTADQKEYDEYLKFYLNLYNIVNR